MKAVAALVMITLAAPVAAADDVTGVVFVAQPVRAPVAPDRVMPAAPFVPAGVGEQTGPVEVGPDRAAALWLDALDVVRVRHTGALHVARVVGGGGTRAQLAEPGAAIAEGVTYIAQPPGTGDVWMIWADHAATIHVERPIARDGRLIWDTTQRELLAWVDRGGVRPAIPVADGAYLAAASCDADAAVGDAIEAKYPRLRAAVRAWRKANIVAAITAVRPLVIPALRVDPLDDLAGMEGHVTVPDPGSPEPRPYHRVKGPRTYDVEIDGPGVLRVEARAVLPPPQAGVSNAPELPDVSIDIASDGVSLGRRTVAAAYAPAPDVHNPPPAFPAKLPLTSQEGDYLGDRVGVSVPLFAGHHKYRLAIEGGAIALRAAVGQRRVRLGEALGGKDEIDHFVNDALDALGPDSSAGAQLVRHLIALRAGAPHGSAQLPQLPPLLTLAWLAAAGDRGSLAIARRAITGVRGDHVWTLVLSIARRAGDGDAILELYRAVPGTPPASLVPDLVALLPRSTPLERVRNWKLAAAELAARARPVDPTIAAAARARWRTGEWAQIRPTLKDPELEPPPPYRWLVEATPQPLAPPRAWQQGDLARLEPGRARTITALPSALDPSRAALLDVFLSTASTNPGPIDVDVDGHHFKTLGLAAIERVQLAVAPGPHAVTIGGPPSLRGWVSHVPTSPVGVADRARVHALWPAEVDGARLSYALPAADLPIEVTLRALGRVDKPIRVTLRADMGAPMELVLTKGAADAKAHAAGPGPTDVTEEMRFVVWPAPGARTIWFETADPDPSRVIASVATRRERAIAAPPAGSTTRPGGDDLLQRVARASQVLAVDPDDMKARASRASDLLDLGEAGLAREDLLRLLSVPAARKTSSSAAIEEELFARLDDAAEPTHVAIAEAIREPRVVAPALAAIASDLAPYKAAAIALRSKGSAEALRVLGGKLETAADPIANAIAARAQLARGDEAAAARTLLRVYQRSDRWPVALEALDLLARALTDRKHPPTTGTIAMTYGIAARVRAIIDHPRVRRALVLAAAQSGWDTLTTVTTSAGHESLLTTQPILPPAPSVLVREAMVAPKWPVRSAHTLTPGNAGVLDLSVPASATLRAQVHCVRVRMQLPPANASAPCSLTARLDNGAAKPFTAPIGQSIDVPLQSVAPGGRSESAPLHPGPGGRSENIRPTGDHPGPGGPLRLGAGRHVVEVALDSASEGDVASVRFTSARSLGELTGPAEKDGQHPIRIERKAKMFVASTATPITATVLGPTTLWVQARSLPTSGGARAAEVLATPKKGDAIRATLALPMDRDNDARSDGRELAVSTASDVFLVLPDAETYQISVKPDQGQLIARMALRDERRGKIPRLPGAWYAAAPLATPPFAIATPPSVSAIDGPVYDESAIGRVGTFSIDVRASQDSRPEEDVATASVTGMIESGLSFRRALSPQRFFVTARAGVRTRANTALIETGSLELYLDRLPLGTTLQLDSTAFTQEFSNGRAWHARGSARLSRRWDWTDTLSAFPSLSFATSYLNTTPEIAMIAIDEIDPDVYNGYRYAHRRDATARFAVHWMPLQDFMAYIAAAATSNQDVSSLDHAGVNIGARLLVPLPLVGETLLAASYGPNYRLEDADRMTAYWRHDIFGRIEFTLWTATQGRFVMSLWDDYYPGSVNAVGATLRFDLTRNRGLADFTANDAPFASLVERRDYAPLETP